MKPFVLESVEVKAYMAPAEPPKNPSPVAAADLIHNANHQIFHNEATLLTDKNPSPVETEKDEDEKPPDEEPEVTLKEDTGVPEARLEQIEELPLEEQAESSSDDEYNPFQFTKLLTKKSRKIALRFRPRGNKVSSKPQQVHRTPELEMIQEDDVNKTFLEFLLYLVKFFGNRPNSAS